MSLPAEIPGFYYDPVKRRYFRLLANHAAPTTSFYTAAGVQRQQEEQQVRSTSLFFGSHTDAPAPSSQRQSKQLQEETRRLRRRRTSPLSNNPFVRCTLGRELGSIGSFDGQEARRQVYALSLEHRRLWNIGVDGNKITAFVTDRKSEGTLVVGDSGGGVMSVSMTQHSNGGLRCDRGQVNSLHHFSSQVTSVCLSPRRMLVASCLGGTSSPSIFRVRLPEPGSEDSIGPGQSLAFSNPVRSIWTGTASTQTGDMALGASTSVLYMREHPNDWDRHSFLTGSDVFAVEFSPSEPSALLCGSRDGAMRLFDIRVRQTDAGRSNLVVRHKSSITHIRHLNEMTMVVHGPQKCALYDLRFPHPGSPSKAFAELTKPVMTYGQVHGGKGYMLTLGFDVCKERQVMVVASEDQRVRLFSMETGNELDSGLGKGPFHHASRVLRFWSEEQSGGVESIMAVDGPALEHYAL